MTPLSFKKGKMNICVSTCDYVYMFMWVCKYSHTQTHSIFVYSKNVIGRLYKKLPTLTGTREENWTADTVKGHLLLHTFGTVKNVELCKHFTISKNKLLTLKIIK